MDPRSTPAVQPPPSAVDAMAVWQALSARRAGYDAMMWQTPALGMTAQAFLFTISLSPDVSRTGRILSASLSLGLAIIVIQLMAKHRRHEMLDCQALERLETGPLPIAALCGAPPHARPDLRDPDDVGHVDQRLRRSTPGPAAFWRASSYEFWMGGQALIGVTALFVLVLSLTPLVSLLAK